MLKLRLSGGLLTSTLLCLGLSFNAEAVVITGASSAFAESVNLNVISFRALLSGGAGTVISGYSPTASGSASPAYDVTSNGPSVGIPSFLGMGVLTAQAASNVDGAPGSRFADATATVDNFSALLGILGIELTATEIQSTSAVSGDLGSFATDGETILTGLALNGMPFFTGVPAPNTVLLNLGGLTITLNEQILSGGSSNPTLAVNAIDINFNNFFTFDSGIPSIVNGSIIIAHSEASLMGVSAQVATVPEPGALLLLAAGLVGFMATKRPNLKV